MHVIGICSFIDQQHAELTTKFAKADYETITSMLMALTSMEGRRATMIAAAKTALNDEDLNLYLAVIKAAEPARKQRNKYAHYLWGIAAYIDDGALLLDPRDMAHRAARAATADKAFDEALSKYVDDRTRGVGDASFPTKEIVAHFDHSQIMVYRENDIDKDIRDTRQAAKFMGLLHYALLRHAASDEARSQLLAEAPIQQALQQVSG